MLRYIAIFSALHAQDIPTINAQPENNLQTIPVVKKVKFVKVIKRVSVTSRIDGTSKFTEKKERLAPPGSVSLNSMHLDKSKILNILDKLSIIIQENDLKLSTELLGLTWLIVDTEISSSKIHGLYQGLEQVYLAYRSYQGIINTINRFSKTATEYTILNSIDVVDLQELCYERFNELKAYLKPHIDTIDSHINELKIEQHRHRSLFLESVEAYKDLLQAFGLPSCLKFQESAPWNKDLDDAF